MSRDGDDGRTGGMSTMHSGICVERKTTFLDHITSQKCIAGLATSCHLDVGGT